MRVPKWLKNPNIDLLKLRVNKKFESYADQLPVLKKMPLHYQKAFMEGRTRQPVPVHYKPSEKTVQYDPEHGRIIRLPEVTPIPPLFPAEADFGLWGGEGLVKGYIQPKKCHRYPFWFIPVLHQIVVHSEILNRHILVTVTERTKLLIDEATGFDFYILKTHQVDLRSRVGMRLKREMLLALARKDLYPEDPEMRANLLQKYREFIIPVEEAEWVGLTLGEAERKYNRENYRPPVPLKDIFREQLLLELNKRKLEQSPSEDKSWTERLNPFASKKTDDNAQR